MVAIKDMEMPQKCVECPCFDREYGCRAGLVSSCDISIERSKDCPLVRIVTCEDCKYREKVHPDWKHDKKAEVYFCTLQSDEYCYEVEDNYFCADGERRE